jgi:hypothetical protein
VSHQTFPDRHRPGQRRESRFLDGQSPALPHQAGRNERGRRNGRASLKRRSGLDDTGICHQPTRKTVSSAKARTVHALPICAGKAGCSKRMAIRAASGGLGRFAARHGALKMPQGADNDVAVLGGCDAGIE